MVVDTEEEFDWNAPFSRARHSVSARCGTLVALRRSSSGIGIKPTYVIDYPVATQPDGFEPLERSGRAGVVRLVPTSTLGESALRRKRSRPRTASRSICDPSLQRAKLEALGEAIAARFGPRRRSSRLVGMAWESRPWRF